MNATTIQPLDEVIRETVKARIEKKAQEVAEEYKAKALFDLDVAVRKAVMDIAVEFSRMISVKDGGDEITIRIVDNRSPGGNGK